MFPPSLPNTFPIYNVCPGGGIFTLGLFLMLRNGPSHEGVVCWAWELRHMFVE